MQDQERKEKITNLIQKLKNDSYRIEVQVLDGGKLPYKVRQSDAGWDLYATSDFDLFPGTVVKHPLNIKIKLPPGTWAEITTKSGLGSKGQLVYAGVIDEEYRGIPHVIMTNLMMKTGFAMDNREPIKFKKGDKIAQMIMNPYSPLFHVTQVDEVDTATSRGEGGFGSTGNQ